MWLSILVVVALIAGIILAIASAGIFAWVLIGFGILAFLAKVLGNAGRQSGPPEPTGRTMASTGSTPTAGSGVPEDTEHADRPHVSTGTAHGGQDRMTP